MASNEASFRFGLIFFVKNTVLQSGYRTILQIHCTSILDGDCSGIWGCLSIIRGTAKLLVSVLKIFAFSCRSILNRGR